jgi:hypothetical protein
MEIKLNGKAVDINLDNEKTVGEIIAGLEGLLDNSGHRMSGISVDGQITYTSKLEQVLSRSIDTVKIIEIYTSSLADLSVESLVKLLEDVNVFEKFDFSERSSFLNNWKESPQALFTAEQMPDLYSLFINSFTGGDVNSDTLISVTEERLREINDPVLEITSLGKTVEETCSRLNVLALDIQTSKDIKAAQTIQVFSGIAEKILRILHQIDIQGLLSQNADGIETTGTTSNEKPLKIIIIEFGNIVKELLKAYEKHDSVLIGDIAEYEASVKLQELYTIILSNISEPAASWVRK